ncbi:hypothetical protein [Butyrivibrio hungatei]|nr:hypothetical protein [Butyrivibrio hungatei]
MAPYRKAGRKVYGAETRNSTAQDSWKESVWCRNEKQYRTEEQK